MQFNDKELAFLRIICCSEHKQLGQDVVLNRLVESETVSPDEFKTIKKKLLYSGVIGVVYGNLTVEKKEIIELFREEPI
jgi:hypothetical protein